MSVVDIIIVVFMILAQFMGVARRPNSGRWTCHQEDYRLVRDATSVGDCRPPFSPKDSSYCC